MMGREKGKAKSERRKPGLKNPKSRSSFVRRLSFSFLLFLFHFPPASSGEWPEIFSNRPISSNSVKLILRKPLLRAAKRAG